MYYAKKRDVKLVRMDINASTFGKQLKLARKRAGLTQPQLLELLAAKGHVLTQSGYSHYERGRRYPDPDLMAAMAEVLGTSMDYLTGLTKTESPVAEIEEELAAASGGAKINRIMGRLPKDKQNQVLTFAEYLLSLEKKASAPDNLEAWRAASEVLEDRLGQDGALAYLSLVEERRPDIAAALRASAPKKKFVKKG